MDLKYKLFFLLFLSFACENKTNKGNEKTRTKNNADVASVVLNDKKYLDTTLYIRAGDRDTALVFFLHNKLDVVDFEDFISYCRLCQEEGKIFKLYRELFREEKNLDKQIEKLKQTKNIIIDSTRRYVISEFKTYGYFNDSPEVDWLLFRCKDSQLIEFVQQLLKSNKLSKKDKEIIKSDLAEIGVN
jgi:hypothetical protein